MRCLSHMSNGCFVGALVTRGSFVVHFIGMVRKHKHGVLYLIFFFFPSEWLILVGVLLHRFRVIIEIEFGRPSHS